MDEVQTQRERPARADDQRVRQKSALIRSRKRRNSSLQVKNSQRAKRSNNENTSEVISPAASIEPLPKTTTVRADIFVQDNSCVNRPPSSSDERTYSSRLDEHYIHSHETMSERRLARKTLSQANPASSVQVPPNTSSNPVSAINVNTSSALVQNSYKAQLIEALRDKRAYASAYITLKEKSDKQEELVLRQEQQIIAMESSMTRVKRGDGMTKKKDWNAQSLDGTPLSDYVGICMSLPLFINKEAFLVVTESTFAPGGGPQIRDWNASAVKVSKGTAEKAKLFIRFADETFGIPTSAMSRALIGTFYGNRFSSISKFVSATLRKILSSPIGKGMSDEQKTDCIDKISVHGPTGSKFRKALREAVNNRKQSGKTKYLKMLGYELASQSKPKQNPERKMLIEEQQKLAKSRLFKVGTDGNPDTMSWRLSSYSSLRNERGNRTPGSGRFGTYNENANKEDQVDILFINEPARAAFNEMNGYIVPKSYLSDNDDSSIISLARADAWITTAMRYISLEGTGGRRNNEFVQSFEVLVGKALERIISDIWEDISSLANHELAVSIGSGEDQADPYCNNLRDWTVVLQSPEDNYLYLLITPNYFRTHVCSWYGQVKDCQIGRCSVGEVSFTKITTKMVFDQQEDSDIETNEELAEECEDIPVEDIEQSDETI